MEQKKQIKIKLSTVIVFILIVLALIIAEIVYLYNNKKDGIEARKYPKYEYWYRGSTTGDFLDINEEPWEIIHTYEEYEKFKEKVKENIEFVIENRATFNKDEIRGWEKNIPEFSKEFFDSHSVIVLDINSTRLEEVELEKINIKGNIAKIKYSACGSFHALVETTGVVYYIVIDNKNVDNVELDVKFKNNNPNNGMDAKPIIYFYPEETTNVTVKVGNPENLTHTYPRYEDGWNVVAEPNSNLIDISTGRSFYALYWEGINTVEPKMTEGFVIEGEDTIEFLEEKLKILGLNDREANEFIIYWLPQMENNKYNFIRFQTMEEIEANMPLDIEPKPDSIIRVMMEWKALDSYIEIPEQKLETPERSGFVAVEWGGTKIK